MIEADILRYGYVFIFFGALVEGDATLLTAAFLAHRGYFHLPWVMLVAGIATLVASHGYFLVARRAAPRWLDSLRARGPRMEKIIDWSQRHGVLLLLGSRYMTGFRTAIPIICGATGMDQRQFALWNTVSAVVWVLSFGAVGYGGGHLLTLLVNDARHHEKLIAVVLAIGTAGAILWRTHGRELSDIWMLRKVLWPDR